MREYLIFIAFLFFSSCSHSERELTLDELIKAKWKPLFNGVDYISNQKAGKENDFHDSLTVKFKGMTANFNNGRNTDLGQFKYGSNSIVTSLLKNTLKESGAGYLRISFGSLVNFSANPKLYLKNIDPQKYFFPPDSLVLLRIPGIRNVKFISKEEAKKVYLADGGEDWSHVITENPLPDAIEINLEYREWTKESLEKLKSEILKTITAASDFGYPDPYEPDENIRIFYYYVYKRN
jgi:hypothetical protein